MARDRSWNVVVDDLATRPAAARDLVVGRVLVCGLGPCPASPIVPWKSLLVSRKGLKSRKLVELVRVLGWGRGVDWLWIAETLQRHVDGADGLDAANDPDAYACLRSQCVSVVSAILFQCQERLKWDLFPSTTDHGRQTTA